jgi:hypothetical protein
MNGREYITRVYEQLVSPDRIEASVQRGAFLRAALSVVRELDSPLKEQTLVNLAVLELRHKQRSIGARKRAA